MGLEHICIRLAVQQILDYVLADKSMKKAFIESFRLGRARSQHGSSTYHQLLFNEYHVSRAFNFRLYAE